jgi:Holliday junction DNA helicase RuvB
VVEPFLLKSGFIIRTSHGRKASEKAYSHLNIPYKNELGLFKGTKNKKHV